MPQVIVRSSLSFVVEDRVALVLAQRLVDAGTSARLDLHLESLCDIFVVLWLDNLGRSALLVGSRSCLVSGNIGDRLVLLDDLNLLLEDLWSGGPRLARVVRLDRRVLLVRIQDGEVTLLLFEASATAAASKAVRSFLLGAVRWGLVLAATLVSLIARLL